MPFQISFARCFAALCLLACFGVLSSNLKAQATMWDIGDYNWFYNGWNQPGATLPDADFTQWASTGQIGPGQYQAEYQLPRGWILNIIEIYSDYEMDIEVHRPASGFSAGATVDTQTGTVVWSNVFQDGTSGLDLQVIFGTPGGDTISMDGNVDVVVCFGMEGDDDISATPYNGSASCVVFGGDGNDGISATDNIDIVYGDWIGPQYNSHRPSGADAIYGFGESDLLLGGPSGTTWGTADYIYGGDGPDEIFGNSRYESYNYTGWNHIEGGSGADWLFGGEDQDRIWGEGGSDLIEGGGGRDDIFGGDGCDDIWGDYGRHLDGLGFSGNDDNDYIEGNADDDFIRGGGGDDIIYGGTGDDAIDGGEGEDKLHGGEGDDFVHDIDNGGGNELYGNEHNDLIFCLDNNGDDQFHGGSGTNVIYYDFNLDTEIGSSGTNTYHTTGQPTGYTPSGNMDAFENFARNTWWGNNSANRQC